MIKPLKRILAMVLVICALMSYTVPAANAATTETYNFNLLSYYTDIPSEGTTGMLRYLLSDYTTADGTGKTGLTNRYLDSNDDLNWTYEAACARLCGSSTDNEHLTNSNVRMLKDYNGFRISMGRNQGDWIAFRIKSPGSGTYTMDLNFYSYQDAPTIAFYILEAEGEASVDHDTVLARQERIQAEMDPDNRIGKVNQGAGTNGSKNNTAYIGSYTFEADKEYILVAETYKTAAVPAWYACFSSVTFTKDGTEGEELTGDPEVGSILVEENLVSAGEGGYMGAVQEVNGRDYFFLPLEGGKMAIYDLDKLVADEEPLVMMVNTGLYYPTHATVTDDGKVIVGGDGRIMFIFDTETMTGRTTPKFTTNEGLKNESHNSSSFYNTQDGLIYIGTASGGHMARYNMETKAFEDLGDMICQEVQELALGEDLSSDDAVVDDNGSVKAVVCHGGFAYGLANSDNYHIIVKYDLTNMKLVGALDVTEKISGGTHSWGMTVLGDDYIIAGANGVSGLALVKIDGFSLMKKSAVTALFDSKYTTQAVALWEGGMTGHATEVIDGMQYFFKNSDGMYSYNVDTGKMAYVGDGQGAFKTGAKTLVTLDRDEDGVEEQYLFSYGGGGQPRLYKPTEGKKISMSGLQVDMSEVGGSDINIGDSYGDVLYIGAWNNRNCVAYDTVAEEIKSSYVTGGQTDSQVSYVDEEGNFHLVSGNYSACIVYEIDPDNKTGYGGNTDSNIKAPLIYKMKFYDQKRIHTVAAGDGYVFAGTIPDTYKTGGGVGVYDGENEYFLHFKQEPTVATDTTGTIKIYGQDTEVDVPSEYVVSEEFSELWELSVQCVEYYDGRLFGTTTRSGGKDADKVDGTSAQIFVMDYENMTIEATLDLRDYLTLVDADKDGVEDPISYVGGISVDEQGRFWGLCSDVLFCFTYDKDTKEFQVQEVKNLGNSEYYTKASSAWKNRKVIFDQDNSQLFVGFYTAGMQQIVLDDWNASVGEIEVESNTKILISATHTYALGANDNLYYASDTNLYMKPVNVAEDDPAWTAAQDIDNRLKALGDITADKADDVAAIKDAYNNLSLREKALVQDPRFLLEAEAQVLELQIEAAINTVTAGSLDDLSDLIVRYNELEADQQRIVQNYTALENAYDVAIELVDEAAEVRDQINALPDEVALTDEAAVVAVREAYDALAEDQKALVDATKLVNAEAQIILLKAADTVQEQINALPDSVTLSDEAAVIAARSAYDALTDAQKAAIDTTKLEAAEARITALKESESIQNMIDALPEADAVTLEDEEEITAARAAYNSTTTAARKLITTTRLAAAEAQLKALKNAVATEYVYDFKLYQNANYMTWLKDLAVTTFGVSEDYVIADGHMLYKIEYTNAQGTKKTIKPYTWFESAYTNSVDWALEGTYSHVSTNFGKDTLLTASYGMKVVFAKSSVAQKDFAAFRINVPTSGMYQIDLSLIQGNETTGLANDDVLDVYIIPAYEDYEASADNYKQINDTYLADETYWAGSLTYQSQANTTDTSVYTIGGEHQLDAGEYVVVIRENANYTCRYVFFDSLTLKKEDSVAVGDQTFSNLEDAFAYQVETGAECVTLLSDLEVAQLHIPQNATLDLNGKTLTAAAFDAVAPDAQIKDSTNGYGMLAIAKEDEIFDENETQLPVYDETECGYRFFKVVVTSVAVTGKSGADPKYWFKVSVENFDVLYAMIQAGSELDIAVKMSWVNDGTAGAADATAGAEFLKMWADKYAAGGDFYITVSAVNTEGLEDFCLTPALAANNVAICGDEM